MELIVRSDDGATVWIDGKKIHEDKTLHSAMNFPLLTVEGGKAHKVEIELKGAESVKKITVNGENESCKEINRYDTKSE